MTVNQPVDVAVVGLGAAGLGALRVLAAAGVPALGIEARSRVGGRAWTELHGAFAIDLGCGWLHSANRNPLVQVAESLGFAIDRTPAPWERQSGYQGMSKEEQAEFRKALNATYERIDKAPLDEDCPASDFLEPGGRWSPLIDAISSYFSGAELHEVSALDIKTYEDTEINWRIERGYGAMIAAMGRGVSVMMDCPVACIDHSGRDVRLITAQGDLRVRKVIVTVPTGVLAEGTLAFAPPLPDKQAAALHVPLGLANKYTLFCQEAEEFPREGHLFGQTRTVETGSYHLRPFGRPLIEVYVGGAFARHLERDGAAVAGAFFTEELSALVGNRLKKRLTLLAGSAWASDPYAGGSYSFARPGHAGDRAILAAPVNDRLFFAGEHCSRTWFSTAHGAYTTGCDAANAAIASLRD